MKTHQFLLISILSVFIISNLSAQDLEPKTRNFEIQVFRSFVLTTDRISNLSGDTDILQLNENSSTGSGHFAIEAAYRMNRNLSVYLIYDRFDLNTQYSFNFTNQEYVDGTSPYSVGSAHSGIYNLTQIGVSMGHWLNERNKLAAKLSGGIGIYEMYTSADENLYNNARERERGFLKAEDEVFISHDQEFKSHRPMLGLGVEYTFFINNWLHFKSNLGYRYSFGDHGRVSNVGNRIGDTGETSGVAFGVGFSQVFFQVGLGVSF